MEIGPFIKEIVAGVKIDYVYNMHTHAQWERELNTRREYQLKQNLIYMKNEVQLHWEYIYFKTLEVYIEL